MGFARIKNLGEENMLSEDEQSLNKLDQKLLQSCLLRIPWRLKSCARKRLLLDLAALCTGLRNAVMIDYAWDTSGLHHQLISLLNLLVQEVRLIYCLGVMCIDDIVFIIHPINLMSYMDATLKEIENLNFIILDDVLLRFATGLEKKEAWNHLTYFRQAFDLHMGAEDRNMGSNTWNNIIDITSIGENVNAQPSIYSMDHSFEKEKNKKLASCSTVKILDLGDISSCCELALPTLNGWLLGYPIIYLFKKENISKAIHTLSTTSLHRYAFWVQRYACSKGKTLPSIKGQQAKTHDVAMDELMSFTLPSELNMHGEHEEWAVRFLSSMRRKLEESEIWKSFKLDVTSHICQSVAL